MSRLGAKDCAQLVRRERIVAIIRPSSTEAALASAAMLVEEGFGALEIALSEPCSLEALAEACATWPGLCIGAGTVLTVDDAERALAVGAAFLVSPNLAAGVTQWSLTRDLLHVPGVLTPTEVVAALDAGATLLKLFPAVTVGPPYVSHLLAPFPAAELVPTGGVDETNALAFLAAGAVAVGIGSALTTDRSTARRLRALVPPTTED